VGVDRNARQGALHVHLCQGAKTAIETKEEMSVDPSDFIDHSVVSDCCGAPVMSGGMCSECHEHCESESIEPSERQLENLADPKKTNRF
jgi:hypothetical protein